MLVGLERRRHKTSHVRTSEGFEVDFLACRDGPPELIQVCADASEEPAATRELRALTAAGAMFPSATKRLLTLNCRGLPSEAPEDVMAQPVD